MIVNRPPPVCPHDKIQRGRIFRDGVLVGVVERCVECGLEAVADADLYECFPAHQVDCDMGVDCSCPVLDANFPVDTEPESIE